MLLLAATVPSHQVEFRSLSGYLAAYAAPSPAMFSTTVAVKNTLPKSIPAAKSMATTRPMIAVSRRACPLLTLRVLGLLMIVTGIIIVVSPSSKFQVPNAFFDFDLGTWNWLRGGGTGGCAGDGRGEGT